MRAYFDIDWQPLKLELRDKVLIPILGDQYGRVLERGELKVRYESGRFFLRYFEHELPIAPRHLPARARARPRDNCAITTTSDLYAELQSILTALEYLPRAPRPNPERIASAPAKRKSSSGAWTRARRQPLVQRRDRESAHVINGTPGDPRSFDALDALLDDQAYRLAYWRVAAEEINYRRFFDINDLAAIRIEVPEVFEGRTGSSRAGGDRGGHRPAHRSSRRPVFA